MILGRDHASGVPETEAARLHPDARLRLPPHLELAKLRETLTAQDEARYRIDRYWRATFLLTFFAIHVGRMDAEWNLVGLLSPGVAVIGDVFFALVLAWGVVIAAATGVAGADPAGRTPAWGRLLAQLDQGRAQGGSTAWSDSGCTVVHASRYGSASAAARRRWRCGGGCRSACR